MQELTFSFLKRLLTAENLKIHELCAPQRQLIRFQLRARCSHGQAMEILVLCYCGLVDGESRACPGAKG
jgi:hypothetical protein